MDDEMADENWLHAEMIICPNCAHELYRVDHSPMLDSHTLYCDQCANSVEIDFYDPVYQSIYKTMPAEEPIQYDKLMQTIEQKLRPCNCGGKFKHNASRRCPNCLTEVIKGESGVDLYPGIFGINIDDREPSPEELQEIYGYEAKHIRRENLWK